MRPLADALQLTDPDTLRQEIIERWLSNKGSASKDDPVWDEACRLHLRWYAVTGSWDIPPATAEERARYRVSMTPQSLAVPWIEDDPRDGDGPGETVPIQPGLTMAPERNWKGRGADQMAGYEGEELSE